MQNYTDIYIYNIMKAMLDYLQYHLSVEGTEENFSHAQNHNVLKPDKMLLQRIKDRCPR